MTNISSTTITYPIWQCHPDNWERQCFIKCYPSTDPNQLFCSSVHRTFKKPLRLKKTSMINQKSHDVFQKKQRNFLVFNFSMWGFVICIVAICLFLVLLLNVLSRILFLQIWELLQLQVYCCYFFFVAECFVNCIFAKCAFVICVFEKLASIVWFFSFFSWSICHQYYSS